MFGDVSFSPPATPNQHRRSDAVTFWPVGIARSASERGGLTATEQQIMQLSEALKSLQLEHNNLLDRFTKTTQNLEGAQGEAQRLEKDLNRSSSSISEHEAALCQGQLSLSEEKKKIRNQINSISGMQTIARSREAEIDKLSQELEEILGQYQEKCDTNIAQRHTIKVQKGQITGLEATVSQQCDAISKLEKDKQQLAVLLGQFRKENNDLKVELFNAEGGNSSLKERVKSLEEELKTVSSDNKQLSQALLEYSKLDKEDSAVHQEDLSSTSLAEELQQAELQLSKGTELNNSGRQSLSQMEVLRKEMDVILKSIKDGKNVASLAGIFPRKDPTVLLKRLQKIIAKLSDLSLGSPSLESRLTALPPFTTPVTRRDNKRGVRGSHKRVVSNRLELYQNNESLRQQLERCKGTIRELELRLANIPNRTEYEDYFFRLVEAVLSAAGVDIAELHELKGPEELSAYVLKMLDSFEGNKRALECVNESLEAENQALKREAEAFRETLHAIIVAYIHTGLHVQQLQKDAALPKQLIAIGQIETPSSIVPTSVDDEGTVIESPTTSSPLDNLPISVVPSNSAADIKVTMGNPVQNLSKLIRFPSVVQLPSTHSCSSVSPQPYNASNKSSLNARLPWVIVQHKLQNTWKSLELLTTEQMNLYHAQRALYPVSESSEGFCLPHDDLDVKLVEISQDGKRSSDESLKLVNSSNQKDSDSQIHQWYILHPVINEKFIVMPRQKSEANTLDQNRYAFEIAPGVNLAQFTYHFDPNCARMSQEQKRDYAFSIGRVLIEQTGLNPSARIQLSESMNDEIRQYLLAYLSVCDDMMGCESKISSFGKPLPKVENRYIEAAQAYLNGSSVLCLERAMQLSSPSAMPNNQTPFWLQGKCSDIPTNTTTQVSPICV